MASKKKNEVSVEFTANLSKFKKNINEATSDISEMASALRLNQTQMKEQGESVELLEKRQQILTDTIEAYNKKLEAQQGQLKLITEAYGADSIEAEKLRTQINNTTNSLTKMTAELSTSEQKLKQAASGIDELHTATRSADNMISELSAALRLNEEQMRTTGETSELVAQRQDLLEQSAKAYEDKLEALNKELEAAVELYGESSTEASKLRTQINNAATAANKLEPSLEGVSDNLEDTDKAAKDAGDELEVMDVAAGNLVANGLTALASGLKNAASEFIGLAEETREYRTEQAKLDTAFQTNGWSADTAKNTYMELYAVLGEEDRSVEAANHLAQLASTQEDLTDWTKICAGVFATFGDSLPIEGLTEAANETAKVGDVTGVLADALNWAGVNEEDFQAALDECSTEQERAAKITETLNGLYSDAADAFYESNESVIEANRVNAEYTDTLADLGEMVEPLSTTFKKGFGNILKSVDNPQMESALNTLDDSLDDMFDSLGDIAEVAGPAFVEIVGFAARNIKDLAIVIRTAVIAFKSLKTVLAAAKAEQIGFSAALAANPVTAVIGGISALVSVFGLLSTAVNEAKYADKELMALEQRYAESQELATAVNERVTAYNDLRDATRETAESDAAQLDHVKTLADELLTLADSTGQVEEADRTRAQFILGELNTALGTEYQLTGNQIENYNELTDSVYKMLDAKKAEALLSGQEDIYVAAVSGLKEEKAAYGELTEAFNQASRDYQNAQTEYDIAQSKYLAALNTADSYELEMLANQRDRAQERLDITKNTFNQTEAAMVTSMIQQAAYNREIATYEQMQIALMEGNTEKAIALYEGRDTAVLESEQNMSEATVHRKAELEQQILDQAETLEKMRQEFEAGNKEIREEDIKAAEEMLQQTYAEWLAIGSGIPKAQATGINSEKDAVYNATYELADEANQGVIAYGLAGAMKKQGNNAGNGLINGLGAMSGGVWNAAYNLAQSVLSGTRSGLDAHSPSRETQKLGKTAPQGLAVGIEEDTHLAEEAAEEQAQSVIEAYSKSIKDLDPYVFGGMKAVLPPETFKGMNAVLAEAGLQVNNNKFGNNALFAPERLTGQMENVININVAPAPTPDITLNLNGREFARATAHDTDMVSGTRQILRDRGLSI